MFDPKAHVEALNAPYKAARLSALKALADAVKRGELEKPCAGTDVNNHIHSTYSFSPYSPAKAVWMSYMAGLCTAGIMDHDSVSGAEEFIEAGRIANLPVTVGLEMRVSLESTPYHSTRVNNPDQIGTAYVALHGIPHTMLAYADSVLRPRRLARHIRGEAMMLRINELLSKHHLSMRFMRDVFSVSNAGEGGSITERHLMYGLCNLLTDRFGKGGALLAFLENELGVAVPQKLRALLEQSDNPHYKYDLLGVLKSSFIEPIYVPASDELMDIKDFLSFAREVGGISCYPYLGDVGDSPTGDKKAQAFEDGFLDEWFEYCEHLGFQGVAYMPTRNTKQQAQRVQALCEKHGFIEISGEDINQPRQAFVCAAQRDPMYRHLEDTTWALIGHELAATKDMSSGMFSEKTLAAHPDLRERIGIFGDMARASLLRNG